MIKQILFRKTMRNHSIYKWPGQTRDHWLIFNQLCLTLPLFAVLTLPSYLNRSDEPFRIDENLSLKISNFVSLKGGKRFHFKHHFHHKLIIINLERQKTNLLLLEGKVIPKCKFKIRHSNEPKTHADLYHAELNVLSLSACRFRKSLRKINLEQNF